MAAWSSDLLEHMNDDELLGTMLINEPKREIRYEDNEAAPPPKKEISGPPPSASSSGLENLPVNFMLEVSAPSLASHCLPFTSITFVCCRR